MAITATGPGGTVGYLTTVTDINGNSVQVLLPASAAVDSAGASTSIAGALVTNASVVGLREYLYDPITGLAVSMTDPVQINRSDTYASISTKTTTLVKSGAGTLAAIVVGTLGTVDTLTVYDALTATGTPIITITSPLVGRLAFDVAFGAGLTIVTGGTTAGNYTVCYR